LLKLVNDTVPLKTSVVEQPVTLEGFFRQVERRAYRTALLSTKRSADALDIVQNAMLRLVQHYRERDAAEWPLLFNRILHNSIMDWHREQTKERKWFWKKVDAELDDEDTEDEMSQVADDPCYNPAEILLRARNTERVLLALEGLPHRQRQAFILRAWEGYDVATTASIMMCSEGSVKTHFFRASQQLKNSLMHDDV
jgi:RNA polymerase sigma-70 factor (ECF subfamily)